MKIDRSSKSIYMYFLFEYILICSLLDLILISLFLSYGSVERYFVCVDENILHNLYIILEINFTNFNKSDKNSICKCLYKYKFIFRYINFANLYI